MTSICNLIRQRQRELWTQYEGIQRVVQEDGGSLAEDIMLGSICEQLDFINELARARLEELEARAETRVASQPT